MQRISIIPLLPATVPALRRHRKRSCTRTRRGKLLPRSLDAAFVEVCNNVSGDERIDEAIFEANLKWSMKFEDDGEDVCTNFKKRKI